MRFRNPRLREVCDDRDRLQLAVSALRNMVVELSKACFADAWPVLRA
jgi:hypothetical protein